MLWDGWGADLTEALAHPACEARRPRSGAASGVVGWCGQGSAAASGDEYRRSRVRPGLRTCRPPDGFLGFRSGGHSGDGVAYDPRGHQEPPENPTDGDRGRISPLARITEGGWLRAALSRERSLEADRPRRLGRCRRSPTLRHRFPPVVIQHAVWLYVPFTLSFRDVEERAMPGTG